MKPSLWDWVKGILLNVAFGWLIVGGLTSCLFDHRSTPSRPEVQMEICLAALGSRIIVRTRVDPRRFYR